MRLSIVIIAMMISVTTPAARAGDLDALDAILGHWISPDGNSRVVYESKFNGNWIDSQMWFKNGDEWKLVGQGGIYRHTSDRRIISTMRTIDMIGIELFETTISPKADGYEVSNVAFLPDGSKILTEEEWTFPLRGEWNYVVFKLEDDERKRWFQDGWVRAQ